MFKVNNFELTTVRFLGKPTARLEKEMVEREKQLMIESNIAEVREHENYINILQSVHVDYADKMDWNRILNEEGPEYVHNSKELESEIRKYTNYYIDGEIATAKKN
ncbi:hypothetical protein [Myroides odoratimimus]|uniref:hypothetical protein n=1 Tax=Myroides odoratimimus TaxID=76832 RepID=UPI0012BAD932|nr:hypothetical protein [Myroides odoratimimus]